MKTTTMFLLASCVISLAQTTTDNSDLDTTTQLSNAAKSGDTNGVVRLLDKGADINAKDNLGTTALMSAIMSGQTETVKLLLDRGADVNVKDNEGFTALMCGKTPPLDFSTGLPKSLTTDAQIDEMKMSELLLDKGADINAKDNQYGDTALTHMALLGFTNVVMLLLDRGADINAKNNNGETALSCAVDVGETNTVKLLLAWRADINTVDTVGETALGIAKQMGNAPIVQLLRQAGATALSASDSSFNVAVASGTNTDTSGYVTNEALLTPFTLTNSAGDVTTNAVLVKLTANKFVYKTDAGGMGMLPLASLPEDLRKKFGYDPQAAQADDEAEQAKKARQQQYDQQQRELAAQQANVPEQRQSAGSDISRSIKAYAEKKWPADFEMQEYTIKEQTDAYNWLVANASYVGVPQDVFNQIKSDAIEKWSDDYEMQEYEIKQQADAYVRLHQ
jgi:ankyrin repeat protein